MISQTASSLLTRYLYTGRELDTETGLMYYRARFYDPTLGKFIQRDPIGFADGTNWYEYVGSNPVEFFDPFGFEKRGFTNPTPSQRGESGVPGDIGHHFGTNSNFDSYYLVDSVAAFAHYVGRSGTPRGYRFSDINTSRIGPLDFNAVQQHLNDEKPGSYQINDIFDKFQTKGDQALFLGQLDLRLKGTLTMECQDNELKWLFEGTLSAPDDNYDFNRDSRSFWAELMTTIGRNLPGKPYTIRIEGDQPINDSGPIE